MYPLNAVLLPPPDTRIHDNSVSCDMVELCSSAASWVDGARCSAPNNFDRTRSGVIRSFRIQAPAAYESDGLRLFLTDAVELASGWNLTTAETEWCVLVQNIVYRYCSTLEHFVRYQIERKPIISNQHEISNPGLLRDRSKCCRCTRVLQSLYLMTVNFTFLRWYSNFQSSRHPS
jgi:hypothetical protein